MLKLVPLFDTINFHQKENLEVTRILSEKSKKELDEYHCIFKFLSHYTGSVDTFNTYRREVERLYHWAWIINKKGILSCDSLDIQNYIKFCRSPPEAWTNPVLIHRFVFKNAVRVPNTRWKPFKKGHSLSDKSIQILLASLGTMYSYLLQEGIVSKNPVQMIRQKTRLIRREQSVRVTRKLSSIQWHFVISSAKNLADDNIRFERHLFLLSSFFLMGVRISELAESERHQPLMTNFFKDQHDCVWFSTVGKGNKYREIAVSDDMLMALYRYRVSLGLSKFPQPTETTPLCPKIKGRGGLGSRQIRYMVQEVFDSAMLQLKENGNHEDALILKQATVHWLRHTSISYDVQHRPREHVRDDAGHESVVITDKYIDVDRIARHQSAKNKKLMTELEKKEAGQ